MTEEPYNGEESENRLEGVVNFSFSNLTNMTSEIMSNMTSQLTIRDQEDAQEVKIFYTWYGKFDKCCATVQYFRGI